MNAQFWPTQFDRLHCFLLNLECLGPAGQIEAVINECNESNGSFHAPAHNRSHRWELNLHGVYVTGASEGEAIRNWKKAAQYQVATDTGAA